MLVFFLCFNDTSRRSHGREDYIGSFLQKDMKFDTSQMRSYQILKEAHMQKVRPLFDNIRLSKDSFYSLVYTKDINDSLVTVRAAMIGDNQKNLDQSMFQHLKTVRNLCTPEQLPKFDSSFKKVIDKMTGRGRKPKEEKK